MSTPTADAALSNPDAASADARVARSLTLARWEAGNAFNTVESTLCMTVPPATPGTSVTSTECVSAPLGAVDRYRSLRDTASLLNLASRASVAAVTTHAVNACTHSVGERSRTLASVALSMSCRVAVSTLAVWSRKKTKRLISSSE